MSEFYFRVQAQSYSSRRWNWQIPGATEDDASDASEISDDEQSIATLGPVLDAQLIDLFNSDTEDEDFDGF